MKLRTPGTLRKYRKSGFTYSKAFRNKNRTGKYKFGVRPVNSNWGPGLINTETDVGLVKKMGAQGR